MVLSRVLQVLTAAALCSLFAVANAQDTPKIVGLKHSDNLKVVLRGGKVETPPPPKKDGLLTNRGDKWSDEDVIPKPPPVSPELEKNETYIPPKIPVSKAAAEEHFGIPPAHVLSRQAYKETEKGVGEMVAKFSAETRNLLAANIALNAKHALQGKKDEEKKKRREKLGQESGPSGPAGVLKGLGASGPSGGGGPSGDMRSVGSGGSRFKVNNEVVELNSDAIIINGAVAGTRSRGPGYQHPEIGVDLVNIMADLQKDTISLVSNNMNTVGFSAPAATNMLYQKAFLSASRVTYLLTQWKASHDEHSYAAAAAAANAAPAVPPPGNGYPYDPSAVDHAVAATEAALASNNNTNGGAQHHLYSMNHAMMGNAAAAGMYGMNGVNPTSGGANGNNRGGMVGVPTLAHVPSGAAMANNSNPQAPSKNESQSAEV